MSNFKDMPLDTTLQKGDIVTITGPGEYDVMVREVTGVGESNGARVSGMASAYAFTSVLLERDDRILTRVQRPVTALPTVEGDYVLTLTNGYRPIVSLRDGAWLNGLIELDETHWLTARVHEGATLTRVIPADEAAPAKLADRIDLKSLAERLHDQHAESTTTWAEDAEALIDAIDNGEFDL